MLPNNQVQFYLDKINLPSPVSHKGQNGKLLVIGGSQLFHASIFWAADVASRIVDMVHFSSPENENNDLVRYQLKQGFWQGIVVDFGQVETYIREDDCVLIGPGMDRSDQTAKIVNQLLGQFSTKKWVIDGGALQMVKPELLGPTMIITPHQRELQFVTANLLHKPVDDITQSQIESCLDKLINQGVTILTKGPTDHVYSGDQSLELTGGNAGMTKGGTGDVLAGLVAALYCKHDALTAAVVGSYVNKKAGEELWQKVGPYFNAQELVEAVPEVLWRLVQ